MLALLSTGLGPAAFLPHLVAFPELLVNVSWDAVPLPKAELFKLPKACCPPLLSLGPAFMATLVASAWSLPSLWLLLCAWLPRR